MPFSKNIAVYWLLDGVLRVMVAADSAIQEAASFIYEAALKPASAQTYAQLYLQTIPRKFLAVISTAASAATVLLWSASISRHNLYQKVDANSAYWCSHQHGHKHQLCLAPSLQSHCLLVPVSPPPLSSDDELLLRIHASSYF